jgi:hypothetical protein
MPTCPHCYSTDIRSNKIPDHMLEKAAHAAQGGHHMGSHALTAGAVAAWGCMKLVNSLRHEWRCHNGHTFS